MGGGEGAKCLVMALCLGLGGPKVLFGTYSRTRKVQNWGPEGHGPKWLPLDPLLIRQHSTKMCFI